VVIQFADDRGVDAQQFGGRMMRRSSRRST
jgi:hypothetical protein